LKESESPDRPPTAKKPRAARSPTKSAETSKSPLRPLLRRMRAPPSAADPSPKPLRSPAPLTQKPKPPEPAPMAPTAKAALHPFCAPGRHVWPAKHREFRKTVGHLWERPSGCKKSPRGDRFGAADRGDSSPTIRAQAAFTEVLTHTASNPQADWRANGAMARHHEIWSKPIEPFAWPDATTPTPWQGPALQRS